MGAELEGLGEQRGGVDVGVAVDLAVAQEGGVLQAGDQAQDAGLLAELQVVLEADEVVAVGAQVLLAKLDDGVGPASGPGVGEADRLHGAEAEGVAAAAGGLFDGQTAFEVVQLQVVSFRLQVGGVGGDGLPGLYGDGFGGGEGVEEAVVLLLGEGAVDVVGGAFVVAGCEVDAVHVDGGGIDDGRDGVVKGEVVGAGEALKFGGERGRGERAGGEDGERVGIVGIECGDLFAVDGDGGLGCDAGGDAAGELDAVDGQGVAGGDGAGVGLGEQDGTGAAHLLLQQPGRGVLRLGLERVGADQFGEVGGLVRLGGAGGAHLVERDPAAERGGLQRGFGAGQTSADDLDLLHGYRIGDGLLFGVRG